MYKTKAHNNLISNNNNNSSASINPLPVFCRLVSSNYKNVPEWSSLEVLFLRFEKMARWADLFAFPWLYTDGKLGRIKIKSQFNVNWFGVTNANKKTLFFSTIPQPKDNIYGSFGIFCPSARLECVDLLETENVLLDWTLQMYLNFTHLGIMNRLDRFYQKYGVMDRLYGDIYVAPKPFKRIELER